MASPCIDSSWSVWYDKTGLEGIHSCIKLFRTSVSWAAANAACSAVAPGVHLVTTNQVLSCILAALAVDVVAVQLLYPLVT